MLTEKFLLCIISNIRTYFLFLREVFYMDLQEFKLKKPEFVEEAKKCKDKFEFTKVAEKHKVKFGADCFEAAYSFFCGASNGEMSEDDLAGVSGGVAMTATDLGFDETTPPTLSPAIPNIFEKL